MHDENFRLIPLTQGQVAKVSPEDFDELSAFKWYANWSPLTQSYYAKRNVTVGPGKQQVVRMHRQVLGLDQKDKRRGDHRNHDTLDNRRDNLRIATHAQNVRNRKTQRNNTSGITGIRWYKPLSKWLVRVSLNGVSQHIGYFPNLDDAVAARREAVIRLHGEFASHTLLAEFTVGK